MPEFYCQTCKQITPHKSIMRRNKEVPSSKLGKIACMLNQVFRGSHYFDMEPQFFCRNCNRQLVTTELEPKAEKINTATQIGAHQI